MTCLDLGDGRLDALPSGVVVGAVSEAIDIFQPDVVVTFGPDGGTGHPDHVASCTATVEAIRAMTRPPRLLHARFAMRGPILVDVIVEWLTSNAERFVGTAAFGHAFKLFTDGTRCWASPPITCVSSGIPRDRSSSNRANRRCELFCILSGSADIVVEGEDGGHA